MIIYKENESEIINFDNIDYCCRVNNCLFFSKNKIDIKIHKYQNEVLAEAALSKIIQGKENNKQVIKI